MTAQTILPANSAASGGFNVTNSAMFDRASTTKMAKTFGTVSTAAQRRKLTLSMWVKPSNVSDNQWLFCHDTGNSSSDFTLKFESQALRFYDYPGADQMKKKTSRLFRDVSAWYHVMLIIDTTLGTAADRVQIYVNGVRETSFSESTNPDQNDSFFAFSDADRPTTIGARGSDNSDYLSGYLAEYHCIVGTAKAHTDFGEFDEDTGIWKPIAYTGGDYSSNGFYLDFADSGDLGDDESGNENDFTETNFAATHQSTDTCTNNFATFNPLNVLGSNIAYSENNLTITPGTSDYKTCISSIAVDSGKWYAEFKAVSGHNGSTDVSVGIVGADNYVASTGSKAMSAYLSSFSYGSGGLVKKYNNSTIRTDATYTDDDIIGIAVDMDNLKLYWSKDGAFQNSGDPTSGATGTGAVAITPAQLYYIAVATISSGGVKVFSANFGSPPYSESGGETDGDGYGNFAHAVPSGYFALNTKNLAEYGG